MDGGRFLISARGLYRVPAAFLAASLVWSATVTAQPAATPLVLETKIPLGQVSGRIDHLGIDVKRQRLFVAELGNNSLGVVDLAAGKVLRTISGLSEPQGVAYVPFADSVFVANAGDGSVHVLRGDDLAPIGRIELGEDADNVRVDTRRNRVLVGYGKGALAVIDPATRTKAADIQGCARGDRSGNPDRSDRYPSQGTSGRFSDRRNRDQGFCQCAGRARNRGRGSCVRGEPIFADARRRIEFPDGDRR